MNITFTTMFKVFFFLIALYTLYYIRATVSILLIALVLAFLLDPLVTFLHRKLHIPRLASVFMVVLGMVSIMLMLVLTIIPILLSQLLFLASQAPQLVQMAIAAVPDDIVDVLPDDYIDRTKLLITDSAKDLSKITLTTLTKLSNSFIYTLIAAGKLGIIMILLFYLMKDFVKVKGVFLALIAIKVPNGEYYYDQMSQKVVGFFQGQILVATFLAIMYTIGLKIGGVDMWFILGAFFGYLSIVPYLGALTAFTLGTSLAFIHNFDLLHPLMFVLWLMFTQALEGYLVTPRIMANRMNIHPVVVIVSLFIGAKLYGLAGMIIALPVAAFLVQLLLAYLDARESSMKAPQVTTDEPPQGAAHVEGCTCSCHGTHGTHGSATERE